MEIIFSQKLLNCINKKLHAVSISYNVRVVKFTLLISESNNVDFIIMLEKVDKLFFVEDNRGNPYTQKACTDSERTSMLEEKNAVLEKISYIKAIARTCIDFEHKEFDEESFLSIISK